MIRKNRRPLIAETNLKTILSVINRHAKIDTLSSLVQAVKSGPHEAKLTAAALVLDANAILRLPSHPKSADLIDYITGIHAGPVILPGQVVQEFWNNQASVAATIYNKIQMKHLDLSKEIAKATDAGVAAAEPIAVAVSAFRDGNDHIFDADLIAKTSQFLERLLEKVVVPYAPRPGLEQIALHRKKAKTPPGFKDDGDGDFLVWVDALFGLLGEKRRGAEFDHVILLTNDKKIDWCRGHTAHPILHAEMKAILGAHLEVWSLDHFSKAVNEAL